MARPIKFKIRAPRMIIVNRCMFCGRNVPSGSVICSQCRRGQSKILR